MFNYITRFPSVKIIIHARSLLCLPPLPPQMTVPFDQFVSELSGRSSNANILKL